MSVKRMAKSFAAILILAPSTRAFAGDNDCVPDTRRKARLVIRNNTPCPVAIYFGDRYQGSCESMMTLKLLTRKTGEIVATARSRCDTWGPVTLDLRAGKTTTWTIDYGSDGDDDSAVVDAPRRSPRKSPRPLHHLEQVLSSHEDEDRRNQGDADNLRRDLNLDADGLAPNLLEHKEQEQSAVDNR